LRSPVAFGFRLCAFYVGFSGTGGSVNRQVAID